MKSLAAGILNHNSHQSTPERRGDAAEFAPNNVKSSTRRLIARQIALDQRQDGLDRDALVELVLPLQDFLQIDRSLLWGVRAAAVMQGDHLPMVVEHRRADDPGIVSAR